MPYYCECPFILKFWAGAKLVGQIYASIHCRDSTGSATCHQKSSISWHPALHSFDILSSKNTKGKHTMQVRGNDVNCMLDKASTPLFHNTPLPFVVTDNTAGLFHTWTCLFLIDNDALDLLVLHTATKPASHLDLFVVLVNSLCPCGIMSGWCQTEPLPLAYQTCPCTSRYIQCWHKIFICLFCWSNMSCTWWLHARLDSNLTSVCHAGQASRCSSWLHARLATIPSSVSLASQTCPCPS